MRSRLTVASAIGALSCLACFGAWVTNAAPESPPTNPSIAITEAMGSFTGKDGWCMEAVGSGLTQVAPSNASSGWREAWSVAPARIPKALVRRVRVTLADRACDSTYNANAQFCHVCVEMGAAPKRAFTNFSFTGIDGGPEFPAVPIGTATSALVCGSALGFNDGGQAPNDFPNSPAVPPLSTYNESREWFIARDVTSTTAGAGTGSTAPPLLWIGEGQALLSHNVCIEVWW